MDFRKVKILEGQSLLDIAIQEYGTTEAVLIIVQDNEFSSIDVSLSAGNELKIRIEDPVIDRDIKNYLKKNEIEISNGEDLISTLSNMVIFTPSQPVPFNVFIII